MIENDPINTLSFVKATPDTPTCYWAPASAENWGDGCALGSSYADEMVAHMRDGSDQLALTTVMRAMRASPENRAVETGFFTRLAEHLIAR